MTKQRIFSHNNNTDIIPELGSKNREEKEEGG